MPPSFNRAAALVNIDGSINHRVSDLNNQVTGAASTNGSAPVLLIPSQGNKTIYIQGLQFGNSDVTLTVVQISDAAGSAFLVPAGGGNNPHLPVPLVVPAGQNLTMTAIGGAVNVLYGNAQGFVQPLEA
jgi:hypothetical protein